MFKYIIVENIKVPKYIFEGHFNLKQINGLNLIWDSQYNF